MTHLVWQYQTVHQSLQRNSWMWVLLLTSSAFWWEQEWAGNSYRLIWILPNMEFFSNYSKFWFYKEGVLRERVWGSLFSFHFLFNDKCDRKPILILDINQGLFAVHHVLEITHRDVEQSIFSKNIIQYSSIVSWNTGCPRFMHPDTVQEVLYNKVVRTGGAEPAAGGLLEALGPWQ